MIREYLLKACHSAEAANALFEDGSHDDAVSRAYYAMFNTIKALIKLRDPDFRTTKHGPTLGRFSELYVKPGDLTPEWGRAVNRAQAARHVADYGEASVSAAEVKEYVRKAHELIAFARTMVPDNDFPELPERSSREMLMDQIREEAAKRALAGIFHSLVDAKGETAPLGFEAELVMYASEDDLKDLILNVEEMRDLKSYVGSRVELPSLD